PGNFGSQDFLDYCRRGVGLLGRLLLSRGEGGFMQEAELASDEESGEKCRAQHDGFLIRKSAISVRPPERAANPARRSDCRLSCEGPGRGSPTCRRSRYGSCQR